MAARHRRPAVGRDLQPRPRAQLVAARDRRRRSSPRPTAPAPSSWSPWPADLDRIDIGDFQGDWTKASELLGWEPAIDVRRRHRTTRSTSTTGTRGTCRRPEPPHRADFVRVPRRGRPGPRLRAACCSAPSSRRSRRVRRVLRPPITSSACPPAPPRSSWRWPRSGSAPATRCSCPRSPPCPPLRRCARSAPCPCSSTSTRRRRRCRADALGRSSDRAHQAVDPGAPLRPTGRDPVTGLPVVEDAAQAHGAAPTRRSRASATAYWFYPTKNLGGIGDGGAVVTDDDELADATRRLRVHGMSGPVRARRAVAELPAVRARGRLAAPRAARPRRRQRAPPRRSRRRYRAAAPAPALAGRPPATTCTTSPCSAPPTASTTRTFLGRPRRRHRRALPAGAHPAARLPTTSTTAPLPRGRGVGGGVHQRALLPRADRRRGRGRVTRSSARPMADPRRCTSQRLGLLPLLQRRRARSARWCATSMPRSRRRCVDDYEIIVVERRLARRLGRGARRAAAEVPALRVVDPRAEPRLRRRADLGLRRGHEGVGLLHRRRRPVRRLGGHELLDAVASETDVVQGWKMTRGDAWYRKVIGRVYHHVVRAAVRPPRPRHRLRLPPVPPITARGASAASARAASSASR